MTVHLVGAGPGDPGLITARGLELVRSCDVLVHDRLVAPELVAEAPSRAFVLCRDGLGQAEVTELLVDSGRLGLHVVRLKGGDPFVFGRGGDSARNSGYRHPLEMACAQAVSSIAAVPAAAGIPVTHRGISDHVTIASCQGADGGDADYARLAAMAARSSSSWGWAFERVVDGLLAAGMPPETPAAAISRGTLPDQEVVRTTLQSLPARSPGSPGRR